jgi:CheY-like chemotaxis protein
MNEKILIVDDDEIEIALARQAFENQGYRIFSAANGEEALDIVNSYDLDLIITDVIMPIMDGVDLFKALKEKDRTKNIPIIIITSNPVFKDSFMSLGGIDGFLEKPIKTEEIKVKVKSILELAKEQKSQKKVIVLGNNKATCQSIIAQLESVGCRTLLAKNSIALITDALLTKPNVIILDVLLKDIPAKETIKALRAFSILHDCKILAYTQFEPEELNEVDTIEQLKEAKNSCVSAGATKYIGRYTKTTFLNSFYECCH